MLRCFDFHVYQQSGHRRLVLNLSAVSMLRFGSTSISYARSLYFLSMNLLPLMYPDVNVQKFWENCKGFLMPISKSRLYSQTFDRTDWLTHSVSFIRMPVSDQRWNSHYRVARRLIVVPAVSFVSRQAPLYTDQEASHELSSHQPGGASKALAIPIRVWRQSTPPLRIHLVPPSFHCCTRWSPDPHCSPPKWLWYVWRQWCWYSNCRDDVRLTSYELCFSGKTLFAVGQHSLGNTLLCGVLSLVDGWFPFA